MAIKKYNKTAVVALGLLPIFANAEDVFELSLEDLLNVTVTSVSKQSEPLSDAPAAIYVITSDDIRRSGATSIPQMLRDVPGLHVAQIDSQKWAVSSRGFNGRFNNKLLVMLDGRALYSPEFSGVYWETVDTLMADIDRIEVIRGPSAAIWGANAVNGVINIVTKHTEDTLGGYAELGAGDYEQAFTGFRYGGKLTDNVTARAYAKGFKRDSLDHNPQDLAASQHALMVGVDTSNDWSQQQAGGRVDISLPDSASLTLSSDVYQYQMDQMVNVATATPPFRQYSQDSFDSSGFNILAEYNKTLSETSEYSLLAYYDYASRDESVFAFSTDIFNLELQHQFRLNEKNNIVWGLVYRHIEDDVTLGSSLTTSKDLSTTTNLVSAFVRDEITLVDDTLWLTLATAVEHNSYTDVEWQPNARLMWKLNEQHRLWSSIAYAVRTPSRAENNINIHTRTDVIGLPVQVVVTGNDGYDSENLLSYELGYRYSQGSRFSIDSAFFYNDYDKLRGVTQGAQDLSAFPVSITQPVLFVNNQEGYNYGIELSSQWLATQSLKFKLNYGYINGDFSDNQTQNTMAPQHTVSLGANWEINKDVDMNMLWRYVDNVMILDTLSGVEKTLDSYQGVDVGLNWHISPDVTLSAYGKNLFYGSHVEYEAEQFHSPYRVEPSFHGKISVSF